ncbi:MAG: hypothetical protein ABII27_00940 [bacterium]
MNFAKLKYLSVKNSIEKATFGAIFKTLFFSSISLGFMLGLYFGFFRLISYLDKLPYLGPILIYKVLSLIFLTTFIMIVFSSLITSLNSLFFSNELDLLFTLPISVERIFTLMALESFIYSSWMVLLVIFPFFAAFAKLKQLGLEFYAGFVFILLPYLIIPAFIGVLLIMVLFFLFPSSKLRDIIFVLIIIIVASLYLLFRLMEPEKLVRTDVFHQVMQYILLLQAPTAFYLPSWWLTESIRTYAVKEWSNFYFYSALLWGVGIFIVYISIKLSKILYYQSWNQAGIRSSNMIPVPNYAKKRLLKGIWAKELILFFRSPEQWPQLFLLISLIIVYLFSIYRLPLDTVYLKTLLSFLNIGFAGFVLSALVLRFVYPAISLEGRSFWLIKSLPADIGKLVVSKWFLYGVPIVCIGLIIVSMSCYLLKTNSFVFVFSVISILFISCGLVSLGIGFAAAFPRFSVPNIAKIESSIGGIYFMISALFYVGMTIALEAILMQIYFYERLKTDFSAYIHVVIWVVAALLVWHALIIVLPVYFGNRSLEKYEIEFLA